MKAMKKKRLLVVDDHKDICKMIKQYFELEGFIVEAAGSGEEALTKLNGTFDIILLDIMMEGMNGIDLCELIRNRIDCPIIFISAKTLVEDKVEALSVGGDDFITKPFSLEELKARIESHLRREERIRSQERQLLSSKNITIDLLAKEVFCYGQRLSLTKKEYELIKLLMLNKNIVFSKETIFERVWGWDSMSQLETITECVKNIRRKICEFDSEHSYIQTVYGLGYKWDVSHEKD